MPQPKRKRIVGRTIVGTLFVGAASLIGLGFVPKSLPAVVHKVDKRTLEVAVEEVGRTRIRTKYLLSAPVMGHLARIDVKVGDVVEQGAVLARISAVAPQLLDERTRAQTTARVAVAEASLVRAQASVRRAETALQFSRGEAERMRRLREQSGASQQALEQAEYDVKAAEEELTGSQLSEQVSSNELNAAQAGLAMARGTTQHKGSATLALKAPVRGQVLRVLQEHEGVVQAGTALVEIGDPRALEVVLDVLTTDAVRIELGAEAVIERWGQGVPLAAKVRSKEPSAFVAHSALGVEEQRVPLVLDILAPPETWRALGDGYQVEARVFVDKVPNALAVPTSALFRGDRGWAVFVLRDGVARLTGVEIGRRNPDFAEVIKGLAAGESVVLYPSDQIAEGTHLDAHRENAM